jgi:hypothetical protein
MTEDPRSRPFAQIVFLEPPIGTAAAEQLRAYFNMSIQYGLHADDSGKNDGHGYVIAQVMEALMELTEDFTLDISRPEIIIQATAILFECLNDDPHDMRPYTLDMPVLVIDEIREDWEELTDR